MKKFLILFLSLALVSCKTQKKYFIDSNDFNGKRIYFSLKEGSSYQKVKKIGEHLGNSKEPNIYEVFKKSIEELSQETGITLVFSPTYIFPNDSIISIMADVKNIDWIFDESKAIMNVNINYTLPDKSLEIIATHEYKVFIAGTKSGNLKKSLKNGHKQILSSL